MLDHVLPTAARQQRQTHFLSPISLTTGIFVFCATIDRGPHAKGQRYRSTLRRLRSQISEAARQAPALPPPHRRKPYYATQLEKRPSLNGAKAVRKCRDRDASRHTGTSPSQTPLDGTGGLPPSIHERNLKRKVLCLRPNTVVTTGIRLLTGHAFTAGEYTAIFCPRSFDPHHCQCGPGLGEPLQTTHRAQLALYTPNTGDKPS
jgi:hypothetical protein